MSFRASVLRFICIFAGFYIIIFVQHEMQQPTLEANDFALLSKLSNRITSAIAYYRKRDFSHFNSSADESEFVEASTIANLTKVEIK